MAGAGTFTFYTKASMGGTPDPLDLTSEGSVAIVDEGIGQHIVVLGVRIDVKTVDSLVTPPVISIGTNSANYDNIMKDYAITTPEGSSKLIILTDDLPLLVSADDIYVNVKIPADAVAFDAIVCVALGSYSLL